MYIKAESLISANAFSTRVGGVSRLSYTAGLNLAFGRGDEESTVIKNLELFAAEVGFDPKSVISLSQIHSDIIYKVDGSDRGQGYYITDGLREGDGYITNSPDVTLGVKSADCVPILFEACDESGEVIAVGAVHAGWRGSVKGIAPKCVRMICEEYGADAACVRVAIGPCIHKCCFEVGEDFLEKFTSTLGQELADGFIAPAAQVGKYYCDLVALNKNLLENEGVLSENIEVIDRCTCCEPEMFFSHRYSKGLRGTMLSVIRMNK